MSYVIDQSDLAAFREILLQEERSLVTIDKYLRDMRGFIRYLGDTGVTKENVISYKQYLLQHYAPASVNSMLASVNKFFRQKGWYNCIVKSVKIQKESFRNKELTKEEYYRLLKTAEKRSNKRLYLLMQTLCSCGIRVSELPFITVAAIQTRRAVVSLKGKTRTVILPAKLCRELLAYCRDREIRRGSIFVTRSGQHMDRSNIWKEMKKLCQEAGVDRDKVFPHNLRHLFACTYYRMEKDISHLADILGHSNINTTRIYTLVTGDEQERLLSRLGLVV